MHALSINEGLLKDSLTAPAVLTLGNYVVIVFSVIFLFYLNSFIIKRRKKEIALYNILGMEKKHIMIMMFCETIITSLIAIIGGIILGAIFSQFMFLILVNIAQITTSIRFDIPLSTVLNTFMIYGCIFFASFLFNIFQIKMSNPVELLKGGQVGEKEPKTKWLMTLIGILTLGAGYTIAQTIEDPIVAMGLFFVAVILVIIGTYSLFTAGSIVLLKTLKKNKRFYYQTRHFTSVSGMIYRMKQNAVGLASICILCTCILVMISSTVTLYLGVEDTVRIMQDEDYKISIYNDIPSKEEVQQFQNNIETSLSKKNIKLESFVARIAYQTTVLNTDNQYVTGMGSDGLDFTSLCSMTLKEYNETYHKNETLKENEVLFADNYKGINDKVRLNDKDYQIKKVVNDTHFLPNERPEYEQWIAMVFKDQKALEDALYNEYLIGQEPSLIISIDYQGDGSQEINQIITKELNQLSDHYSYSSQYGNKISFIETYGSLFFLGVFLGVLFLMAAILIMYYKQLSEGYEDQKRFEIMQNVGMSKKEVKQTIKSQVLIFFFLPLVVAVIHMAFAYKMIVKMFSGLILSSSSLFVICTLISVIILAIVYSIIYVLTARTYYKIVKH